MAPFYITSSSQQGNVLSLTGTTALPGAAVGAEHFFEVKVEKLQPKDPIPLHELISDEGNFAVYARSFLWRVDVSLESRSSAVSHPNPVPSDQFRYHEYGLPPVVYAHITGALTASL